MQRPNGWPSAHPPLIIPHTPELEFSSISVVINVGKIDGRLHVSYILTSIALIINNICMCNLYYIYYLYYYIRELPLISLTQN